MFSDTTGGGLKEFYGYLILGLCTVFGTATLTSIGITPSTAWFIWTFPLALVLAVGYSITAMTVAVMFNLRDLGRIGEMLVGALVGTVVLLIAGKLGFGLTLDHFGGAIAGGIIGSCAVTIIGTLTGRLQWYGARLWVERKPTIAQELASRAKSVPALNAAAPPVPAQSLALVHAVAAFDPRDNRSFEITLKQPANLRFEHNGKVVYEQRAVGNIKLMLRDFAPFDGDTVVFIDDEPFGSWSV